MVLGGNVESLPPEKEGLVEVVTDLEAPLKESESRLEESELQDTKERETSM